MDPTPQARQAAVSALSSLGCEKSELLLRVKALSKDETPELIGKCFTALIAIQPQRSIPFVAKFLSSQDIALAEYAAAALGESHERQAFEVLCDYWEINADLNFRKPLLLAISLTRLEEAFQFLLDRIIDDSRTSALAALEALEMYTSDDNRLKQIWQAVVERGDSVVKEAYLSQYQLPSS
jgi:HEAT repeat protein